MKTKHNIRLAHFFVRDVVITKAKRRKAMYQNKPEPEQDEIIIEFSDEQAELKKYYRMLHSHEAVVYYSGYKHGYTSRNAEIEALNETHELETKGRDELRRADVDCILRLREENRKQTEGIEALKAEIESMKCCGNCKNCLIEDQYEGHYCFIDELLIEDIRVHKCSNWKAKI